MGLPLARTTLKEPPPPAPRPLPPPPKSNAVVYHAQALTGLKAFRSLSRNWGSGLNAMHRGRAWVVGGMGPSRPSSQTPPPRYLARRGHVLVWDRPLPRHWEGGGGGTVAGSTEPRDPALDGLQAGRGLPLQRHPVRWTQCPSPCKFMCTTAGDGGPGGGLGSGGHKIGQNQSWWSPV